MHYISSKADCEAIAASIAKLNGCPKKGANRGGWLDRTRPRPEPNETVAIVCVIEADGGACHVELPADTAGKITADAGTSPKDQKLSPEERNNLASAVALSVAELPAEFKVVIR